MGVAIATWQATPTLQSLLMSRSTVIADNDTTHKIGSLKAQAFDVTIY